jgi:predicted nucleic acid-binding Zn ribbon protein
MVKITATKEDFPRCPECGTRMDKVWITPEGGFVLKGGGWFNKGGY